jgi:hypothetical protein
VNAVSFKEHRNIIYNTDVRFLYFSNYCCLLFSLTVNLVPSAALLLLENFPRSIKNILSSNLERYSDYKPLVLEPIGSVVFHKYVSSHP